jgi:hypothetical protein
MTSHARPLVSGSSETAKASVPRIARGSPPKKAAARRLTSTNLRVGSWTSAIASELFRIASCNGAASAPLKRFAGEAVPTT